MIANPLLLTEKEINFVLTLGLNLLHGSKLNCGQDLFRNRRIRTLVIEHPAHAKMVSTV